MLIFLRLKKNLFTLLNRYIFDFEIHIFVSLPIPTKIFLPEVRYKEEIENSFSAGFKRSTKMQKGLEEFKWMKLRIPRAIFSWALKCSNCFSGIQKDEKGEIRERFFRGLQVLKLFVGIQLRTWLLI